MNLWKWKKGDKNMNSETLSTYSIYANYILIALGVIIITSIWVAYDANLNKIPITHKPYSLNNGSLAWFLTSLILWPFTFPYYFVKRSDTIRHRSAKCPEGQSAAYQLSQSHAVETSCPRLRKRPAPPRAPRGTWERTPGPWRPRVSLPPALPEA